MGPLTPELQQILSGITNPGAPPTTPPSDQTNPTPPTPTTPPSSEPSPGSAPLAGGSPQPSAGAPPLPTVGTGTPSQPTAPAADNLSQKFGKALDNNPIPAGPGGWAKSILSAASTMLSGLGDSAEAGHNLSPGEGGLTGLARTLQARNQRITEQKRYDQAQSQKNQERQDKLTQQDVENKREQLRTDAYISTTNAQMLHEKAATYQLGDAAIDKAVKEGVDQLAAMNTAAVPPTIIQHGVDAAQMHSLLDQGKINGHEYLPIPTGTKVEGFDKTTGTPIRAMTYDIASVPDTYTPSKDMVAQIRTVPGYENYQEGTVMSGAQTNLVMQQARNISTANAMRDKAMTDAGLQKIEDTKSLESAAFSKDGEWLNALGQAKGNPSVALAAMIQNSDIRKKYPNLLSDVQKLYGGTDPKTGENIGAKNIETIRNNFAEDATKRADANAKIALEKLEKLQFMGNGLTGEAFLSSLPPGEGKLVKDATNGQMAIANLSTILARNPRLGIAMAQYDPTIDQNRLAAYPKLVTDFTTGDTSKQLVSGAKAIRSLRQVYDDTTYGSLIPDSQTFKDRTAAADTAALEGAKFQSGANTAHADDVTAFRQVLDPHVLGVVDPLNRKAAIKSKMKAMQNAYDEIVNKGKQGAPSPTWEGRLPTLSDESRIDMAYVLNDGKPAIPDGASVSPNGKLFTFDGKSFYDADTMRPHQGN